MEGQGGGSVCGGSIKIFVTRYQLYIPGTIGPICSERTIGPRAQSLLTGSQETEIKKPMSSIDSIYDAVVAPRTSIGEPSELACIDNTFNKPLLDQQKTKNTNRIKNNK